MILSSWLDEFPISVHHQEVCDGSPLSCHVDLTISQFLSILSEYVMVLNDPVKLTLPFPNLCPSSASMWWFSMILSSWPDHFPIYVYPQIVCDGSPYYCQVDLTISQFLSILRLFVSFFCSCELLQLIFWSLICSKYVVVPHLTLCMMKLTWKCLFQGSGYWYSQPLPVNSIILCFFITSLFRQCLCFKT